MQTITRTRTFNRREPIDCAAWLWFEIVATDRRRVRIRFEAAADEESSDPPRRPEESSECHQR